MDLQDVIRFSGNLTVDGVSVPVDIKDTAVGDEMFMVRRDKVVYVAYLRQDSTASNPLDDMDCYGSIYTSQRGGCTHREMQEALGLDSYWSPNFDAPAVIAISAPKVLEALVADAQFMARVKQQFEVETDAEAKEELWKNYLDPETYHRNYLGYDFPNPPVEEDSFNRESWALARRTGKIGNPFAVSLDVYEHGLVSYSPSGEGMNCDWDTSRGCAVWVPDSYLERELWGEVLTVFDARVESITGKYDWVPSPDGHDYGDGIKKSYTEVVAAKHIAHLKGEKLSEHTTFEDARDAIVQALGEAFDAAKGFEAVRPKAREYARQACELYSAWCNGECYFVTVEKWKLTLDEDGDIYAKFMDSESGGNIVGSDNAEDNIKEFLCEKLPSMEAA